MRTDFGRPKRRIAASSRLIPDETYDLRGLNLVDPDQIMPKGESPYNLNCRMYARNEDETRVAIRTRRGTSRINTAQGETLDTQNVAANTGDLEVSTTRIVAQPWDPTNDGVL